MAFLISATDFFPMTSLSLNKHAKSKTKLLNSIIDTFTQEFVKLESSAAKTHKAINPLAFELADLKPTNANECQSEERSRAGSKS